MKENSNPVMAEPKFKIASPPLSAATNDKASSPSSSPAEGAASKKRVLSPQKPLSKSPASDDGTGTGIEKRTRVKSPLKPLPRTSTTAAAAPPPVEAAPPARRVTRQSLSATRLRSEAPENPFKSKKAETKVN